MLSAVLEILYACERFVVKYEDMDRDAMVVVLGAVSD